MDDQRTVNFLNKQLSLRKPQYESLRILADVLSQLGLSKDPDLQHWLTVIQGKYPTVKAFEREFPSLCFALATGVGKTRLMGAMIAWLYLTGRSRNFFILAPNLTIYEKLKQDFNLGHPKYVFKGIAEFVQTPPTLITGDDYEDGRGVRLEYSIPASRSGYLPGFETDTAVHINIFNISKINAKDNKKGAAKSSVAKMRRLQEYIGDSYFNHLAELPDLVVLMDEAHRYYASAGAKAINELKPILGIELTATPKTVGAKPRDFNNIIYHYPLSKALEDGYVKIPAVATRKDFNPKDYSPEALEKIKLEDGIHHHEFVKVELHTYAISTGEQPVKPFMLVVAQDTQHASQLKQIIESLFDNRYAGKVIEIHSKLKGDESDENMQRLLEVEHDNDTEIVIHVNKLKEGWDVTNLYTIVPNTYTMAANEQPRDFRSPVTNKQSVKKMLFTGFKRCCYPYQKFDSVEGELMLARVLENDGNVHKWMKPAAGKFRIEYQNGEQYEPDFVVETDDSCLLIEPKRKDQMDSTEVKIKQLAAQHWCDFANEHAAQSGGKRWHYLLLPHDEILANSSVSGLCAKFANA